VAQKPGSHHGYHDIEEAFKDALDESLVPRGPDMLYDLVADFCPALASDQGRCRY
jgi:hypothetical protein